MFAPIYDVPIGTMVTHRSQVRSLLAALSHTAPVDLPLKFHPAAIKSLGGFASVLNFGPPEIGVFGFTCYENPIQYSIRLDCSVYVFRHARRIASFNNPLSIDEIITATRIKISR